MNDSLTPKQRAFCKNYIENGGNVIDAAKNAGYTKPEIQGIENLEKTKITEYINKLKNKEIDADKNWEKRKLSMDTSFKMLADNNMMKAIEGGAIAAIWHAHKPEVYDDDEDRYGCPNYHWTDRNNKLFVMRNSWAVKDGLVKNINGKWLEDLSDLPSDLSGCTCYFSFIYSISRLAREYPECLTKKSEDLFKKESNVKSLKNNLSHSKTNNKKLYSFLTIILLVIAIIYFIFISK